MKNSFFNDKTLIYGFTIFAMFFGSGNLVFPLKIGYLTGANWIYGFFGLFLTGIVLPFLGLIVVKLYSGNFLNFFGQAGVVAKFILPLFILSLLGSFGVVPRCITVAYSGIEYIWPNLSLIYFSLAFCSVCYFCCLKENIMINIIGKWLTPIMLTCVLGLILIGIYNIDFSNKFLNHSSKKVAFMTGFLEGYETMDLFAAFFFSSLIFSRIKLDFVVDASNNISIIRQAVGSSIIGAILLTVVYFGFVILGAYFQKIAYSLPFEFILPAIIKYLLGDFASIILTIIVLLACMTTAIALCNIYAKYLKDLFKLNSKYFSLILFGCWIVAFNISLYDFQGIANFLGPLLQISHPSLVVLTIFSILTQKLRLLKVASFYFTLILMIWFKKSMLI